MYIYMPIIYTYIYIYTCFYILEETYFIYEIIINNQTYKHKNYVLDVHLRQQFSVTTAQYEEYIDYIN